MPITDQKLKSVPREPEQTIEEELQSPQYINVLDLSDEDQKRIVDEICDELDVIEAERNAIDFEGRCDSLDNQYDGKMAKLPDQMFNLDKPVTKTKIREFVRQAKKAFFETDPVFAVTPRPEFQKIDRGIEVCEKQQEFLDHKIDDVIPLKGACGPVFHQAALKGIGILKLFPEADFERKSRDEVYSGELQMVTDEAGRPVIDPDTGEVVMRNPGLEEFMENYAEEIKAGKYENYIKSLSNGGTVSVVVSYLSVSFNDVMPSSVDPKRFWVRKEADGYRGLVKQRFKAEEKDYTWWELKEQESRMFFYNLDRLIYDKDKNREKTENPRSGYKGESYKLFECEYTTTLPKRGDEGSEERKAIFWIDREKRVMVGSIEYPFYSVPTYWFPINVKNEKTGWYKDGIACDLTDSHIAQNAMLNFTLQGAWQSNTITPITKNPEIIAQFLSKEFDHGLPIEADPGEIGFLNGQIKYFDSRIFLELMAWMTRSDEDSTGISTSVLSGRENPMDPNAPAAKHAMQLQSTNQNIRDYIEVVAVTFNEVGQAILQFYYQMADDAGIKYPSRNPGKPFKTISRSEMVARTNIQTQAMAFNFEKVNEKREDLALFQLARQDMMFVKNPDAIYMLWKNLLKSWSPKWRNMVDKVLPSPEEFKQEQIGVAIKAVQAFVQQALQQAQITGQEPQFNPMALMQMVQQMQAETYTAIPKTSDGAPDVGAEGLIRK